MKHQFEVPFGIGVETLNAYKKFEFDIRDAILSQDDKQLRKRVELAISKLERTFCPQQKEVNKNAS